MSAVGTDAVGWPLGQSDDDPCSVCTSDVGAMRPGGGERPGRCSACLPAPPRSNLTTAAPTGWYAQPLAALDFETTGIDPHEDRIVSFAMLSEPAMSLRGYVQPGIAIPAAASAVHGITEVALAGAPTSAEALVTILGAVDWLIERAVPLVVFNAAYDLTMLRAEAQRHGFNSRDWSGLLVIDPMIIDWGIGGQTRRLSDVAAYYDVDLSNAHDATADAQAACSVAVEIGARHRSIGELSAAEVTELQRAWYARWVQRWNVDAEASGRALEDPIGWPFASSPWSGRPTEPA